MTKLTMKGSTAAHLAMATIMAALSPNASPAQSAPLSQACASRLSVRQVAIQTTIASAATGVEYRDMTRTANWHVAKEDNRSAIIADPSSHLHSLGSYRMARNLAAFSCDNATTLRRSALVGAAVALTIGAAKEVADGWYNGFSVTDLAVDATGAGFAVAQAYVPALRHVTPMLSVSPRTLRTKAGAAGALTDYANQTMWLSANVHELLPTRAASLWPSALRLSAGRRATGGGAPSDYVLGLDIDAAQLPGTNPAWMRVKQVMHNMRLPGPAVVMGANGTRAVGLYW